MKNKNELMMMADYKKRGNPGWSLLSGGWFVCIGEKYGRTVSRVTGEGNLVRGDFDMENKTLKQEKRNAKANNIFRGFPSIPSGFSKTVKNKGLVIFLVISAFFLGSGVHGEERSKPRSCGDHKRVKDGITVRGDYGRRTEGLRRLG